MRIKNKRYKMKRSHCGVTFRKSRDGCELVSLGGKVKYSVEPGGRIRRVKSHFDLVGRHSAEKPIAREF